LRGCPGLQQLQENIVTNLSNDVLELCEQLVEDYDTLDADLVDIGVGDLKQRENILHGLQLIMSREYKLSDGNRFQDMAAEKITRFIRYAAAVKTGE
jgi:hypothetical protein